MSAFSSEEFSTLLEHVGNEWRILDYHKRGTSSEMEIHRTILCEYDFFFAYKFRSDLANMKWFQVQKTPRRFKSSSSVSKYLHRCGFNCSRCGFFRCSLSSLCIFRLLRSRWFLCGLCSFRCFFGGLRCNCFGSSCRRLLRSHRCGLFWSFGAGAGLDCRLL